MGPYNGIGFCILRIASVANLVGTVGQPVCPLRAATFRVRTPLCPEFDSSATQKSLQQVLGDLIVS